MHPPLCYFSIFCKKKEKLITMLFYTNLKLIIIDMPYLLGRWMFLSMTFFLFTTTSIWFRFFGAFFLGAMLFLFRPALRTLFGLMVMNSFMSFIVRWMWVCCLWTSRRVARIFPSRWWSRWCCVGFGFSPAISIIIINMIIADVTDGISWKQIFIFVLKCQGDINGYYISSVIPYLLCFFLSNFPLDMM